MAETKTDINFGNDRIVPPFNEGLEANAGPGIDVIDYSGHPSLYWGVNPNLYNNGIMTWRPRGDVTKENVDDAPLLQDNIIGAENAIGTQGPDRFSIQCFQGGRSIDGQNQIDFSGEKNPGVGDSLEINPGLGPVEWNTQLLDGSYSGTVTWNGRVLHFKDIERLFLHEGDSFNGQVVEYDADPDFSNISGYQHLVVNERAPNFNYGDPEEICVENISHFLQDAEKTLASKEHPTEVETRISSALNESGIVDRLSHLQAEGVEVMKIPYRPDFDFIEQTVHLAKTSSEFIRSRAHDAAQVETPSFENEYSADDDYSIL